MEAIKHEQDRLARRRGTLENRAERLKDYLLREMEVAGIDKVKRDLVTVSVRINPASVNIIDEEIIPSDFQRVIPERWEPDKKAIMDYWKEKDIVLPGVEIIADRKRVEIK